MAGCRISESDGVQSCLPESGQCICPENMKPVLETMYWSCEGDHWEVEKVEWGILIEKYGCSGADADAKGGLLRALGILLLLWELA